MGAGRLVDMAERCSAEPWPGAGQAAAAVAIRTPIPALDRDVRRCERPRRLFPRASGARSAAGVFPSSPAAFPCLLHRNLFLPDAAQDLGVLQLPVLEGLSPCPERGVIVGVVPKITMLAWGAALQEL